MAAWKPLFACMLLAALVSAQTTPSRSAKPDVFLVTIDTLRADHVRCYGYERIQTPALDGLASDGVRFAQAFTPSPITNTSHASILTGLLPGDHGVTDFAVPLASSHPTLAEMLKRIGYRTAAFPGAVILDARSLAPGLDRGFDFYDNFPEHGDPKSPRWGRVERRGMEVVQHAIAWMNGHRSGPRFVWVHLYDPHDPYEPPAPYSETYKERPYDGEIAYADAALGKLLGYLKQQGGYESSLIVVASDHGEGLGEHGEETHGIFLYDSTTHVPLLFKPPCKASGGGGCRGTGGKVVSAQVRTTDIFPTVLELAGAAAAPGLDGESLMPWLGDARCEGSGGEVCNHSSDRTAFGETDYPLRFGWAPLRSVRERGFKYIEAPRPELYDLRADAGELKNLYQPWNETVQKLRGRLAEQRAKRPPAAPSAGTVAAGTLDELRALGYLGPADAGSSTSAAEPSLLPDPKDRIEEQNLLHRAMMASEDNRVAEASRALEKVLELNPKSPTALRQLGELELSAGEYEKAAGHLGRARETRPDDATAAYYLGQALEKLRKYEAARDALEASLKLTPGQFAARLLLGEVYLALKDPTAAEDQFEAALLIQPKSKEAQQGLAKAQQVK